MSRTTKGIKQNGSGNNGTAPNGCQILHNGPPERLKLRNKSSTKRPIDSKRPVLDPDSSVPFQRALITGGAGFIGTNLAAQLAAAGVRVHVFDNLSRDGVEKNASWLCGQFGNRVVVEEGDVRDARRVQVAVGEVDAVFHLAAQVAVTTSLDDPREDFEVNARGTLNVLEACRHQASPPALLFTSTNKVYGGLDKLPLRLIARSYRPEDRQFLRFGLGEDSSLDFHSPYGCSKGAADQYVLDYARCYRLPTVVFRMSCIYGPHQCGNEDQGWIAHFARSLLAGRPITIYGDGCQVRDVLYVDDLVQAMTAAHRHIRRTAGRAFNMGGGPDNAVSLLEVIDRLAELHGEPPEIHYGTCREGDQRYYVSDTRAFQRTTGWRAETPAADGIARLYHWMAANLEPAREVAAELV